MGLFMIVHPLDMPDYLEGNCKQCKHPYADHYCWCYDSDDMGVLRISCNDNDNECECDFTIEDGVIDWNEE